MNTSETQNFHISLPCDDVTRTTDFYVNELGFETGRTSHNWVDVNFFGNQIIFAKNQKSIPESAHYSLDNKRLPIFHIGIILDRTIWNECLKKFKLKSYFEIEPSGFLMNKVGEHDSFFIKDPNGYHIEFKTFNNKDEIFQK